MVLRVIGGIMLAVSTLAMGGDTGLINHTKKGVAIAGYDVVAYFQNYKNGIKNKGTKGTKEFSSQYKGITYYFSSLANKELFVANPENYIPAYGGWCAWAMSYGKSRVAINNDTFLIAPDANGKERLYLFYNSWGTNTLNQWLKGEHGELVAKADIIWQKEVDKAKEEKNLKN